MAKEIANKLVEASNWQAEYPCNNCKARWDCDNCEELKKWMANQKKGQK